MSDRLTPTGDGSYTLYSPRFRQTFHSTHGALTEARHVYVAGSGVEERLRQGRATRLLEVGFGAGLNFLATAAVRPPAAPLTYVALEQTLLPASLLARLDYGRLLPEVASLWTELLAWRASLPVSPPAGRLVRQLVPGLELELVVGEATAAEIPAGPYQAIYLDAFSPETNPELWAAPFLARLYRRLAPDGRLATYSVKGTVRRRMQALGFRVEKRPGPPGKREMLVASR